MTSTFTRKHDEGMLPARPGHQRVPGTTDGVATSWDDGMTTYTLQWGPTIGHFLFGWMMADEMDTALVALEAIRAKDTAQLRDRGFLTYSMSHVRQLRQRLEAIEEELLLQARDEDPTGEATLSWRDAGDELRQHYTSVRERWQRSMEGKHAEFRNWLVQGLNEPAPEPLTAEESARRARIAEVLIGARALIERNGWSPNKLYDWDSGKPPAESPLGLNGAIAMALYGDPEEWSGKTVSGGIRIHDVLDHLRGFLDGETATLWNQEHGRTQDDVLKVLRMAAQALVTPSVPEHVTEVFGNTEQPGQVRAQCICGWTSEVTTNVITAGLAGKAHCAENNAK